MGRITDDRGHSIVDFRGTSSNNIPEIYRVLGIEAARRKIFLEMRAAYVAYGVFINYRHYSILIDTMCHRGYLMAVSRTGINRSDAGPLMCASFEETLKVLMGAAAFGVKDPVRGVSANLILGNQVRVGTGIFDLILDTGILRHATHQKDAVEQQVKATANIYHGLSSVVLPNEEAVHTRQSGVLLTDKSAPYTPGEGASAGLPSVAPSAPFMEGTPARSDVYWADSEGFLRPEPPVSAAAAAAFPVPYSTESVFALSSAHPGAGDDDAAPLPSEWGVPDSSAALDDPYGFHSVQFAPPSAENSAFHVGGGLLEDVAQPRGAAAAGTPGYSVAGSAYLPRTPQTAGSVGGAGAAVRDPLAEDEEDLRSHDFAPSSRGA